MKLLSQLLVLCGVCLYAVSAAPKTEIYEDTFIDDNGVKWPYDLPACPDEDCDWCQDCTCDSMTKFLNVSAEDTYSAVAEAMSQWTFYDWAMNDTMQIAANYTEAQDHSVSACRASAEAAAESESSAYSLAQAFATTICAVIPNYVVSTDWLPIGGIPAMCKDCQKGFAKSTSLAMAAAKAAAKASAMSSAAATAVAKAEAKAEALAVAVASAYAESLAVSVAAGFAMANASAMAYAQVHVNCSGVFWYANLTAEATTRAQLLAYAATDAMGRVEVTLQTAAKVAVKAIATASTKAKAAAGAAAKAKSSAKASTEAIAVALGACEMKPNVPKVGK